MVEVIGCCPGMTRSLQLDNLAAPSEIGSDIGRPRETGNLAPPTHPLPKRFPGNIIRNACMHNSRAVQRRPHYRGSASTESSGGSDTAYCMSMPAWSSWSAGRGSRIRSPRAISALSSIAAPRMEETWPPQVHLASADPSTALPIDLPATERVIIEAGMQLVIRWSIEYAADCDPYISARPQD